MAFSFRLQKVLNFRQRTVDQLANEMSQAARVVARIQARIHSLQDDMATLLAGKDLRPSAIDVQDRNQRRVWLDHLAALLQSQEKEKAAANVELAQHRARLVKAWRDLEVLQKLKERQKAAWLDEQMRRENRDLDEIGQIRADRQRREKLAFGEAQPTGSPQNSGPSDRPAHT